MNGQNLCTINFFMEGKMVKNADFDVSGPGVP